MKKMNRRDWLALTLGSALIAQTAQQARAAASSTEPTAPLTGPLHIEGYTFQESQTVGGTKLFMNGAGVRKRGFYKTEAGALYLKTKQQTFDGVFNAAGPKRIRLVILRDIPSSLATRYFLSDFRLSATDEEFNSLLDEVSLMGRVYGNLPKISKGDVVDIDWVPGSGFMPSINGHALLDKPITNERFFLVVLRNYIDSGAPVDYRKALLGLTPPNAA